jgi:hypothetical protein
MTCTPIVYSQPFTESDDVEQIGDEEGEKGTSDDEPDDSTMAKMKRMPRRSLFMEGMAMHLPKPHTTPEKMMIVPDMKENLESCMTRTQDLIQDRSTIYFRQGKIDENEKQHQGYRLQ